VRYLLLLLLAPFLATNAVAEDRKGPSRPPPIRLEVRPAAEPVPALRYKLLPELRDLKRGNAALLYYRSFSPEWLTHLRPEVRKKLDAWSQDTKKAPSNELRWVLHYRPLQEIDRAARRTYCDWELNERVREEGINLLLPDVQSFREFARLLAIRARLEMMDGQHDKVAYTLQTGFCLGRDVSNAPTLIQALVGMALAQIMLEQVEHWMQTPGSPNLYWSLTDLPRPIISLRRPFQGERMFIDNLFPGLREVAAGAQKRTLTPDELEKAVSIFAGVTASEIDDKGLSKLGKLGARLALATLATKAYPEARRRLIAGGRTPKEVDAMPVLQVVLLHEILQYDRIYDDLLKWTAVPYGKARPALERYNRELARGARENASVGGMLARLLLPAVSKVLQAQVRVDRHIAALRCVAALRLYAAAHAGKLPARLEDITEVPIPSDPMTGKPFDYHQDGDRAFLSGLAPAGEMPHLGNTIRYEIVLKK
jgi:hypothetical protein